MQEIHSEFKHENLTSDEADFLIKNYRKRGVQTSKTRSKDGIGWTITALLQEDYSRTPSRMQTPNVWGNANVSRVDGRSQGDKRSGSK